jgi:hypothetical protein
VQRVYNITVEGEHVYYVSTLAALAHNSCVKAVEGARGATTRMQVEEFIEDGGAQVRPIGGLERPPLEAGTEATIEGAAERNPLGQFLDKKGNVINRPSFGHKFGRENRRIIAAGKRLGLNQKQLDKFVNAHPDYFFIQEYDANVGHLGELPGDGYLEPIIHDMEVFFGLK